MLTVGRREGGGEGNTGEGGVGWREQRGGRGVVKGTAGRAVGEGGGCEGSFANSGLQMRFKMHSALGFLFDKNIRVQSHEYACVAVFINMRYSMFTLRRLF